jgi:hypothetical protein
MLDEQKGSEAKVKEFVLIRVLPASAGDLDAIVRRVWSDLMS